MRGIDFIKCECGEHGIGIRHEPEIIGKEEVELVITYMSYWVIGKWNMSIFKKIRYCWHIITTGNVYEDMVRLDAIDRKRLITALMEADDYYKIG